MENNVCSNLANVQDVRSVDPNTIADVIEQGTETIENWVVEEYDLLLAELSPEGYTTITTFMTKNTPPARFLDVRASFSAAGSATVPLFVMQQKCKTSNEPATGVSR